MSLTKGRKYYDFRSRYYHYQELYTPSKASHQERRSYFIYQDIRVFKNPRELKSLHHIAVVKGDKGLCDECLELVLRKEEKKDVDPNQCNNDFSDPSTKEFFFYDYWRIIKKKECLTSEEVIAASNLLKMGENYKFASDSDEYDIGKEKKSSKRKRPKRKQSAMKNDVLLLPKQGQLWLQALVAFPCLAGADYCLHAKEYGCALGRFWDVSMFLRVKIRNIYGLVTLNVWQPLDR
ncbi:hypothetical protein CUMW_158460 [Citrus unshiu]|uniref:Uncharacterized protein n=1 Tax=Citrus unshiu TaxID=55188 RepID=A0A2H5PQL3_CITUN|nr:hypothetical protein CUMW_158460 [Citrus unshiu]